MYGGEDIGGIVCCAECEKSGNGEEEKVDLTLYGSWAGIGGVL